MMLFPFVWMILSAFKTRADVYAYPPRWLPSEWSWDNFRQVFEMIPFLRYYANSRASSSCAWVIIASSAAQASSVPDR